jgi:peroxiredoxin Q/BCP
MQACAFRDQYEDFVDAGAVVVGISRDSVESHQQFIANRRLPFTLLSDPGAKVHEAFGVGASLFGIWRDRITFVIDPNGKIRFMANSKFDMKSHVNSSLAFIKGSSAS